MSFAEERVGVGQQLGGT